MRAFTHRAGSALHLFAVFAAHVTRPTSTRTSSKSAEHYAPETKSRHTQAELRKLQEFKRTLGAKNCQMTFCAFIGQSSRKDIGYAPLALQRCKRYPYLENAAKLPAVAANNSQVRAVPEVPRPDY